MTNQTNLDYLFKLTAPLSERGTAGSAPANGLERAFDDHLVQASAAAPGGPTSAPGSRNDAFESAPPQDDGPATSSPSDESEVTAPRREVEESSSSDPPAASAETDGANREPIDGHDNANEQTVSAPADQFVDDTDVTEDENKPEPDDSRELAAAAVIVEQEAVQQSLDQASISDDVIAETANSNAQQDAPNAEQSAGKPDIVSELQASVSTEVDVIDGKRAPGAAVTSLEVNQHTASEPNRLKLDSSPAPVAGAPADAHTSQQVAATESKPKHDSTSRKRHPAIGDAARTSTAPAISTTRPAAPKSEKAISDAERQVSETEKPADESRRSSALRSTQRGEAGSVQDKAVAAATNVAAQQVANSVATSEPSQEASRVTKPVGHSDEGVQTSARPQRAGAAATRRGQGASSPDLPRVDAARFVGRVAKAVQTAQERGGALQLRLSPPELGSLRLELTMQNGVMTATVETETPAARQVLLDHLPALRERLAEQNIRIERFDVDVRQENSGGQADSRASQQERRDHQPHQSQSRHAAGRPGTTEAATDAARPLRSHLTNGELNLLA
jgi:flagellar hook-length control protein FliK